MSKLDYDIDSQVNTLNKLTWPTPRKNVIEAEKNEFIGFLKRVAPRYSDDVIKMVSEARSHPRSVIQVGKVFDVMSLLSCNGRSYELVRNSGEVVKFDEDTFQGKCIMVCCFDVPLLSLEHYMYGLLDICNELYGLRDDFDMVVVAKMNDKANHKAVFDHFFSGFPFKCLAVPFSDSIRRDYICNYVGLKCHHFLSVIVDGSRTVCWAGTTGFPQEYGADTFPFDKESLRKARAMDRRLLDTPLDLKAFLEGSPSNVVYQIGSNKKVTISELNGKLVGLYLFNKGSLLSSIKKVYEQCKTRELQLEIILVYLPFQPHCDPHAYQLKVDTMMKENQISWCYLPFNNSVSRRLWRLCKTNPDDKMIIVGPHGEFASLYGGKIFSCYGVDAYPFTSEVLVQFHFNKLRATTLESLLVHGTRDYVLRGTDKVPIAELEGNHVLVYLGYLYRQHFYHVVNMHWENKALNPKYEAVLILLKDSVTTNTEDNLDTAGDDILSTIPWLMCPYDPNHSNYVAKKFFPVGGPVNTFVEFGENGKICSIQVGDFHYEVGLDVSEYDDNLRKDIIHLLCEREFMDPHIE